MKKNLLLALIIFQSSLQAEIVTDGTVGPRENLRGPHYLIGADLGQQYGPNLFHSFQLFNLNSQESATFTGPPSVANVLTRITGGQRSFLNGPLRSEIPNANLYLLNPNGILFGEQARLDISGSFHASTADYLRLGDNGYFSAHQPNSSLLTVAPIEAFGFLGDNPAAITVQKSSLRVPTERNLSMIGGHLLIQDGTLFASGGQINLIAVASKGEVRITPPTLTLAGFEQLGQLEISQVSLTERFGKYGGSGAPANIDVSGFKGGQVFIRAGQFKLDKGFIFADTMYANGRGIDIQIDGEMRLTNGARITAQILPNMQQISQNIQGGHITVTAAQIRFSGINNEEGIEKFLVLDLNDDEAKKRSRFSAISTDNFAAGKGGNIDIRLSTHLEINPGVLQTVTNGPGNAGNIHVQATDITLHKNGFINTSTALGKAGHITFHATDTISLQDDSNISSAGKENAFGPGGNISLTSRHLNLKNNAEINSYNHGSGDAGNIEIKVDTAFLTDKSHITTYAKNAGGGYIDLNIRHQLLMMDSRITAQAEGIDPNDDGGNVIIDYPQLVTLNNSHILASAKGGDGGDITITSNHVFRSSDSVLNASSDLGIDGEIQINAPEENLDEELVTLPQQLLDAARLFRKNCVERARDQNSFVVTRQISAEVKEDLLNSPKPPIFTGLSQTQRLATYQTLQTELAQAKINFGLQTQAKILAQLASLYAAEQRYQEALQLNQQALDVLLSQSEQAYETYLQQSTELSNEHREALKLIQHAHLRYRWQWQRARFLKAVGQPEKAIAFYQKALASVDTLRPHLTRLYHAQHRSEFQDLLNPLFQELVSLLLQQAKALPKAPQKTQVLQQILVTLEQLKAAQLQDYFQDDCIEPTQNIGDIGQHTAVLYPIFLPDRVALLVSLPTGEIRHHTVTGPPSQLTQEIKQLHQNLTCQQDDYEAQRQCQKSLAYQKPAHRLYQWLIEPLEPLLASHQIDTLVFVPDGPLYTIPMAVLYDGKKFLIEKYALAIVPGLTLKQPQTETVLQTGQIRVLFTGLTQSQTKPPQPLLYAEEKGQVIRALFATDILQGQRFVKTEIEKALATTPYAIVHIESHAQFKDSGLDTYVNTYNAKLRLNDFETLLAPTWYRKQPIELLTLGACETAEGNERAALGLAGIAFKAGARSAIGSLWTVYEDVSFALFQTFYQQLHRNHTVSRAKLLQSAQNTLLQQYPDFKHPHYWSAFLLIGNWL